MRRLVHLPPRGEPRGGAVPAGSWRPPLAAPRASYSGSCSSSRSSVGRGAGCGQVNAKILGGQEAEDGKWPWQVSVRIRGKHVCGGSLITQQWVLTAGHCILSRFHYDVKMGDRSVYKEITSVLVPVRDIIVHPQLSVVGTIQKDLALLQLLYPVNFTMTIQPICIPQKTFRVEAGTTCWVTGWGRKEEYGGDLITSVLHEVDQDIIHHEKCNEMIQKAMKTTRDVVLEGMLCGYKGAGKDLCQRKVADPCRIGWRYAKKQLPEICRTTPFSLWLNTNLHIHRLNFQEAGQRTTARELEEDQLTEFTQCWEGQASSTRRKDLAEYSGNQEVPHKAHTLVLRLR
ncbi:putative serine protease 42 isoform X3 [Panthera pardus]|uniref:Serine protease 42 isoform X3 n=1 Tax=Panthera pardus TaxID=9691 RepID=A0A9W2V2W5_PANPR|nr:putative serine protease 42 isoform X3 [Panthera pardus]